MKSLVKAKREPGIWMEDVPVPEYGVNDVLIKIKKPPSVVPTFTFTPGMTGHRLPFLSR
ncbi:hypothetical protein Loa_00995 [Legionella oakridgensis ATCC 33761 = DSM 21215]|uniref:L-threonine 3-dehydrogenase n=1 Tax=Legionella oakridgensis ATCC 33761 = DSM 21215 TaxID=1268635 RepID=W0BCX4_9GAMM|nr:hypothetical protein Loa_00995 [Legionella oakridgensis ATCC 33761 = DSM 21215]